MLNIRVHQSEMGMVTTDAPRIGEKGVATLPVETWKLARLGTEIIGPLAVLKVVDHLTVDTVAHALGLFRRQVYVLINCARHDGHLK